MGWFNKIKSAVRRFWISDSKPANPADKSPISTEPTPVVQVSARPGLDCPECGHRIPVTIHNLLHDKSIICGHCLLELAVDTDKSKASMDALSRLDQGLNRAQAMQSRFSG